MDGLRGSYELASSFELRASRNAFYRIFICLLFAVCCLLCHAELNRDNRSDLAHDACTTACKGTIAPHNDAFVDCKLLHEKIFRDVARVPRVRDCGIQKFPECRGRFL